MRLFSYVVFLLLISIWGNAQVNSFLGSINSISTAVPFLLITPDARGAGMGETGVATSPDANSIHWNPAKLSFADKKASLAISYTPWLRALIPDVNLAYISFYSNWIPVPQSARRFVIFQWEILRLRIVPEP